jgi:hypothetical protein
LKRYPENDSKAFIYYNLYRLYGYSNPVRSAEYSSRVIKEFPESVFAKVILDPAYNEKADEKAAALNRAYNTIYDLYTDKKYGEVITRVSEIETQFGPNPLSSQLSYLHALATGRTQKLDLFENSLQRIIQTYPDDQFVTPLVKQNLAYIAANRNLISRRSFALVDSDPSENQPIVEPKTEIATVIVSPPASAPVNPAIQPSQAPGVNTPANPVQPEANRPITPQGPEPAPEKASIFSLPETAEYYYVVNVQSGNINLSSSRFGIGQFNRANYAGAGISHQLQAVNRENQLIYVGPFKTRMETERYLMEISPRMTEIMKIPANSFNSFIITKADLSKLNNRNMINSYAEFYSGSKR